MDSKATLDLIAIGTTVGSVSEILPPVAAIFTIVWTAIRIYETETMQRILGRVKRHTSADN